MHFYAKISTSLKNYSDAFSSTFPQPHTPYMYTLILTIDVLASTAVLADGLLRKKHSTNHEVKWHY